MVDDSRNFVKIVCDAEFLVDTTYFGLKLYIQHVVKLIMLVWLPIKIYQSQSRLNKLYN